MTLLLAIVAGLLIGLSLGALGGGGSILAVPVLVYALNQSATQATTGSLVVVGVTALIGAATASRAGNVLLSRGVAFGAVAIVGAVVGAKASDSVSEAVLLGAFAVLMLVVGALMTLRQLSARRASTSEHPCGQGVSEAPILTWRPAFHCDGARALRVLIAATVVGLLTGFLGVGGGFLIVPALVLTLAMPIQYAVGTSLVVITLTSVTALVVRAGVGVTPDWTPVLLLTGASALGAFLGARLASRVSTDQLSLAFTVLVVGVAIFTAARALPALV